MSISPQPRRLFLTAAIAATTVVTFLQAGTAHATWLGKRGVIAVAGRQAPGMKSSIWFVDQEGSGLVEMTPNDGRDDSSPAFSPEGGPHVAYVGTPRGGGPADLFIIDRAPGGGGLPRPVNLTAHLAGDAQDPAFDPSGGAIVFALSTGGGPPTLWVTNWLGTRRQQLTCCRPHQEPPVDRPIQGSQPAWSPDTHTIAFVAPDPSSPDVSGIWLAATDRKTQPVFLTDGEEPNWSPLGDRLVYSLGGNLWVAKPDPSDPRPQQITDEPPGVVDAHPVWTPDSTHLPSFDASPGSVLFDRAGQLWTVGAAPVAGVKQPHLILSSLFDASSPTWQPRCSNNKPRSGAVIRGTPGPDLLCGGPGNDTIRAGGGFDRIYAGNGSDVVFAGPGDDYIEGGTGTDGNTIYGGTGNDYVLGGQGPDRIYDYGRNSGDDTITAGPSADLVVAWDGIEGNDTVMGGDGSDTCVVDPTNVSHGHDVDLVWDCEKVRRP
jgi:hypothetical protein